MDPDCSPDMKKALKPFKIICAVIVLAVAGLFTTSVLLQDKVAHILIGIINSKIATSIEPASAKLSFLSSFPQASVSLRNVLIRPSSEFDHSGFTGVSTDTLLWSKLVTIEFSPFELIQRKYRIKKLTIKEGKINLLTDASGMINYDLVRGGGSSQGGFNLNLDGITLTGMKAVYNDLSSGIMLKGSIEKSRLKTHFSGRSIDFSGASEMQMDKIRLWGTDLPENLKALLDIDVRSSGDTTYFRQGTLRLDDQAFSLKGIMYPGSIPSLHIVGDKIDFEKALSVVPGIREKLIDYHASGRMKLVADITGPLSKTGNPHIEITGILEKGRIRKTNSHLSADNISFAGSFTNGRLNNSETSSLLLHDVKMKFGSYPVSGSLNLSPFRDMIASATLKGRVGTDEFVDFFSLSQKISGASGSADADISISAGIPAVFDYSFSQILAVIRGRIHFNSFAFTVGENGFSAGNANGDLSLDDDITAKNLSFRYRDHSVLLDGTFSNFPEWLSAKPVVLAGKGKVEFNRLDPARLFGWDEVKPGSEASDEVILPSVYNLDLNFRADTLVYRSFLAADVSGALRYVKSEMNFSMVSFRTLEGIVKGSGMFFQNSDRSFILRAIFDMNDIDINKAFISFRNFGQDFIKSENLAGRLSGSLNMLLPMNSSLDPQIKFLTADGKYVISNGSLINFDPVKKLSSYVEVSELQNIKFERLENDFFIRNNFFYVPKMNISSSAVTLTVNGRHSFDNEYTYHVKMLLSEVLSKRFNRKKRKEEDFGPVQDDGLGRTSLLLKVEGKGDVIKTGYDIKAAGEEIKSSMKKEKNNLKTIMKEEYGWYKKDSTVKTTEPVKEQKQPRFRVVWDEGTK
jgi:hypothetical protein